MTMCSVDGCVRPSKHKSLCVSHYKRLRRYGNPCAGGTSHGAPLAWLHDVALNTETYSCVEWPFAKAVGYGSVRVHGQTVGAHRHVCELAHGQPLDPSMEAAHSCGNPACCNPHHLRWATPAENSADKKTHGTQPVGERVGGAKFKNADILEMRRLRKCGLTFQEIADQFNHDIGATRRIIIGETWSHLPL